jgi:hypothetical protein
MVCFASGWEVSKAGAGLGQIEEGKIASSLQSFLGFLKLNIVEMESIDQEYLEILEKGYIHDVNLCVCVCVCVCFWLFGSKEMVEFWFTCASSLHYSPNCLICLCFSRHIPTQTKEKRNPSRQKLAFRQNNGCQLYDHIKK